MRHKLLAFLPPCRPLLSFLQVCPSASPPNLQHRPCVPTSSPMTSSHPKVSGASLEEDPQAFQASTCVHCTLTTSTQTTLGINTHTAAPGPALPHPRQIPWRCRLPPPSPVPHLIHQELPPPTSPPLQEPLLFLRAPACQALPPGSVTATRLAGLPFPSRAVRLLEASMLRPFPPTSFPAPATPASLLVPNLGPVHSSPLALGRYLLLLIFNSTSTLAGGTPSALPSLKQSCLTSLTAVNSTEVVTWGCLLGWSPLEMQELGLSCSLPYSQFLKGEPAHPRGPEARPLTERFLPKCGEALAVRTQGAAGHGASSESCHPPSASTSTSSQPLPSRHLLSDPQPRFCI